MTGRPPARLPAVCDPDAGIVGLARELAALPTAELRAQLRLLRNAPEPLATLAAPRLSLVTAELARRWQAGER